MTTLKSHEILLTWDSSSSLKANTFIIKTQIEYFTKFYKKEVRIVKGNSKILIQNLLKKKKNQQILPLTLSIKSFIINPFLLETTHEYFPEWSNIRLSSCSSLASIPLSKKTFLVLMLFVSFPWKVH